MNLPDHLSAEAALALCDLLSDLQQAIWEEYESVLIPLCMEELQREVDPDQDGSPPQDFNDQLPLF